MDSEINPTIEPAVSGLAADVNRAVDALEADLRRSTLLLAKDLAALGPPEKQRSIQVEIDGLGEADFEKSLSNLGFNPAGIGVALTFDAIAISQSRIGKLIWEKIKSIAMKMFGKQVAKATASVGALVVDGPLPFGDIIAIGGLIWTGYDVYARHKDFEKDLRTSLSNLLLKANHDIHKQAVDYANSLLKEHQEFQDAIGDQTAEDLSSPST